jgi:hypothetical protein
MEKMVQAVLLSLNSKKMVIFNNHIINHIIKKENILLVNKRLAMM